MVGTGGNKVPGKPQNKAVVVLGKTQAQLEKAMTTLKQLPNSEELINETKDLNNLIQGLYWLNPQALVPVKLESLVTTYCSRVEVKKVASHNERVALMTTKEVREQKGRQNNKHKKDLIAAATKVVTRHIAVVNNRIAAESGPTESVNTIKGVDLEALSNARTHKGVHSIWRGKQNEEAAVAKQKAVDYASKLKPDDLKDEKKLAKKRKLEEIAKEKTSKTKKGEQRKKNTIEGKPLEDWIEKGVENLKGCYYPMDNVELDPKEEKKWDDEWDTIEPSKEAKDILAEYLNRRG